MSKLSEEDLVSPSRKKGFTPYWDVLIDDLKDVPNVKKSHLLQLRLLCELYMEYDRLTEIIAEEGYSYSQEGGRYGNQEKTNPNVAQRNKTVAQIKDYSLMLGLTPMKSSPTTNKAKESEQW